ncbi:MAG: PBSX family phage terminase large subunit [Clostridiales bacterium]|nr:PBSX family phage terminase large subunit [Clostridiales bacterium]
MKFSAKQRQVLTWWGKNSVHREKDAIICDGAVRSGKTLCLGISFFCWAMARFDGARFALCGKTVASVRRNLLADVAPLLKTLGFGYREKVSQNTLTLALGNRENTFYLFGGRDEGSAALIQGVTLAGVLLDEAALMPRSFVEQACARCSVEGARLWFSCNPEGPGHWFYKEWILQAEARNALYLHFTMEDNPALSPKVVARYQRAFQGTFYRRFVLGEWVAVQGLVYDFFDGSMVRPPPPPPYERWCISCDYGTVNPASFGLWGEKENVWYRVAELYYDSRAQGRQKTDREYVEDVARLAGGREIDLVVVDPSAASFIEALRRARWRVIRAENDVLSGIRMTAEFLREGRMVLCEGCRDALREIALYSWDQRAEGVDRVKKEHDHAMDEIRYFAATVAAGCRRGGGCSAVSVERRRI